MSSCPKCNSVLYSRTPRGWQCSSCRHLEPLEDADVLICAKPGRVHGNVWGERRNPNWDTNNHLTPRSAPKRGSFAVFRQIRERNPSAALGYLLEHHFAGKDDLNRRYFLAEPYLELGKLAEAKRHIEVCLKGVAQAKKPEAVKLLQERISAAERSQPGG